MKGNLAAADLRQNLLEFWQARAARERTALKLMAIVLAAGSLWALYAWTDSESKRLDRMLPLARAQVQSMQDTAAALANLRAQPKRIATELGVAQSGLRVAAQAINLQLSIDSDGQGLVVRGEAVNFDAWLNWLAAAQRDHGLRPRQIDVSQSGNGVRVDAYLSPAS